MPPLNILIVGGGVAGNALAILLMLLRLPAKDLPTVTMVERSGASRSYGQNVDIRGTGIDILRKLGVEDQVRDATTGEEGVRIVDERNRIWAEMASDKTGEVQTGTSDVEILRGRLTEILTRRTIELSEEVKRQGGNGVEILTREWLSTLDQDGEKVRVSFANSGEKREYDLVVGADGLQSLTRKMTWGTEDDEARLNRIGAYGAFFSMRKGDTDGMWRRWYHAPGRRSIMVRPSDQPDRSTVFMIVVNDTDSRFQDIAKPGNNGVSEQKALLYEYFKDAGWEGERIIAEMNASEDFYYDVVAQVKMNSWSQGRVVLLGDAGYCGSPFSGMGTTLALNGAYNLTVFQDYESRMRPLVDAAQKLPPGMPHLIHPQSVWGIWVLRQIAFAIRWSGIGYLLAKFAGPPARAIEVEDLGIRCAVFGSEKSSCSVETGRMPINMLGSQTLVHRQEVGERLGNPSPS